MTPDELTAIAATEIEKLSAEDREILQGHLGTHDPAALARLLAEVSEEMWTPAEESGVEAPDWPRTYIETTLELLRNQQREYRFQQIKANALEIIDALDPARRALLCWRYRSTNRRRVAGFAAVVAAHAIEEGLVAEASTKESVARTIEMEIEIHIDEMDAEYFQTNKPVADDHDGGPVSHGQITRLGEHPDGRRR